MSLRRGIQERAGNEDRAQGLRAVECNSVVILWGSVCAHLPQQVSEEPVSLKAPLSLRVPCGVLSEFSPIPDTCPWFPTPGWGGGRQRSRLGGSLGLTPGGPGGLSHQLGFWVESGPSGHRGQRGGLGFLPEFKSYFPFPLSGATWSAWAEGAPWSSRTSRKSHYRPACLPPSRPLRPRLPAGGHLGTGAASPCWPL